MKFQELGRTGLKVSQVSYGASALGGVFGSIDETEGIKAVHTALDHGLNYFDVAPAYGGTVAESVLGKALRGIPRDQYFLSTKAGKYTAPGSYGADEFAYSEKRIRSGLAESMSRLGVDYLDIVHLHDFEYQNRAFTDQAFATGFPTLAKIKHEGLIGSIGAGIYPLSLWHRVIDEAPVDAMILHNHYCLNDTRAVELIDKCQAKNIGIINASPFSSGALSGAPPPPWHPADHHDRLIFAQAASFCQQQGISLAKIAIQFACLNSPFHTTMFSTASPAAISQNLAWIEEPLDQNILQQVRQILGPVMNKQWDYDAAINRLDIDE